MYALQCAERLLTLNTPRVMGILNVTPDSFSDGGRFYRLDDAMVQVDAMLRFGADIIDVGGESTRPGAQAVEEQAEIDRVVPVIEAISSRFDVVVSVDTSKASVISAAHSAGAGMVNDVRALREPGALAAAAATRLPVCLMHMKGEPRTMQQSPHYENVTTEVVDFLMGRRKACIEAGIRADQIVLDPGFGFGKTLTHNLELLSGLGVLCEQGPVLTGLSRKRMLGEILGDDSASRVTASVTAALLCVQRGASIVRVHDVEQTVQAIAVHLAASSADLQSVSTGYWNR